MQKEVKKIHFIWPEGVLDQAFLSNLLHCQLDSFSNIRKNQSYLCYHVWGFIEMTNYLMEEFNIASMEEISLQKKIVFIKFNWKTNIGLARGGQMHLSIISHLILIQFYNMNYNIMI